MQNFDKGEQCALRRNGRLIGELLEAAEGLRPGAPRLLRLLCRPLFHGSMYTRRTRIARGAYAEVRISSVQLRGEVVGM